MPAVLATTTKTITVTGSAATSTFISTVTTTPAQTTDTITTGTVSTVYTLCSTTATSAVNPVVNYPTFTRTNAKRDALPSGQPAQKPAIPPQLSSGCSSQGLEQKISSACSCFLTSLTSVTVSTTTSKTVTTTTKTLAALKTTVTSTVNTALPAVTVTTITTVSGGAGPTPATSTVYTTDTTATCTSTTTSYISVTSCGIPSPTAPGSGTVTCAGPAPAGQTLARFRIEGKDSEGTLWDGCIASGAEDITTPNGGTHKCDGTNNGANPTPGGTLITQIDAAARVNGFTYDGTYSNQFDDFFISRIGNSDSNDGSNRYWGVLQEFQFTPAGGCEDAIDTNSEGLWAYNAFNANYFLRIEQDYQVLRLGQTVSVTVIDGQSGIPISDASIAGVITDANGRATFVVPSTPGCYQYKATRSDSIRSNAFYLTVLPAEG